MLIHLLLILLGFVLLAWGADRLVDGSTRVARHFNVSYLVIGLTLVALGTSLPEVFVSTYAAIYGNPVIAVGNALGSNIANIGLVLGITVLLIPISVHVSVLRREFPLLFLVMIFASLLMLDGNLSLLDGLFLLIASIAVVWWLFRSAKQSGALNQVIEGGEHHVRQPLLLAWFYVVLGIILLPLGSHLVIANAVPIARHFGVSDLVIGLSLVALGTSLPELATTIAGARKKQFDLVVGNVLGSNIFNLLLVLAFPAMIAPIKLPMVSLFRDLSVMFILTVVLFIALYFWRGKGRLGRVEGLMLIGMYVVYIAMLIVV